MSSKSYKNTEIGMLPVEWDVKPFDETFRILNNNTFSRDELNYVGGTCKDVHYGDVLILFDNFVDISDKKVPFINNDKVVNSVRLKDGDIIIADTAEDETVGKAVEVINSGKIDATSGLHTMLCRKRNDDFSKYYLGYYINSKLFHNQLLQYITGTKVSSVSKTDIKKTYVVIPHKDEQERIVQCLMSLDSQIQILEKIIEKKKYVFAEVKNKLLFKNNNGWEEKPLKSIINFYNGYAFKSDDYLKIGKFQIITIKNVQKGYLDLSEIDYIDDCPNNIGKQQILEINDILISMTGNVGRIALVNKKNLLLNQRVGKLVPRSCINYKLLYYLLCNDSFIEMMMSQATGTAQLNLSKSDIEKYIVHYPKDMEQQIRIVSTINSYENELKMLELKHQKLKNIKSTILEDLITGKRRLTK